MLISLVIILSVKAQEEGVFKTDMRQVVRSIFAREQAEGVGARVRRSIGGEVANFDPFLLLDEARVKAPAGFPDHPHRGFETVSYLLEGSFFHEDSKGNSGLLEPGDLQWMTAGRGIVHSEKPHGNDLTRGLQLWVNLKKSDKMVEPAYQELKDKNIPRAKAPGVEVKVIAGESLGIKSGVRTRTPTLYLDFKMDPHSTFIQDTPEDWNCFAYVLDGKLQIGGDENNAGKLVQSSYTAILSKGKQVKLQTVEDGARFVLIGGQPLNEPVIQHGPFVMNTREEIYQAIRDFQTGSNGFENGVQWLQQRAEKDEL